jgi:large subunit ribosomal protein L29
MVILRSKDIRKLTEKEFSGKMVEIRKELLKLSAQKSVGSVPENPGRIRALKRIVARMLTIKKQGGNTKKQ